MTLEMTAFRLIPFQLHGGLEMFTGLFLLAAPFLFGFGVPATVVALLAGVLVVGAAFGVAAAEPGRPGPSIASHHAFDLGIAIGLFGAAAVLGAAASDTVAAVVLLAVATMHFALCLTTRYSLRG
jgi:hypothetical protein